MFFNNIDKQDYNDRAIQRKHSGVFFNNIDKQGYNDRAIQRKHFRVGSCIFRLWQLISLVLVTEYLCKLTSLCLQLVAPPEVVSQEEILHGPKHRASPVSR